MSIQDIANYVRQTPGNTNPSVIKSMVKSEVAEYVEEASNEALRKLGVHEEPAKVYTFDGKTTDEDETNGNLANINGAPYWKFGVGSFDLNNIAKAEFCVQGTTVELVEFIVTTGENGVQTAVANIDGMELPAVVVFDGCLYGFCEGDAAYIAKIAFAETIHPISEKYLPESYAEKAADKALEKLGIRESAPVVVIPNGSYEFDQGEYGVEPTQFPKVGDLITLTLDGVVYSETGKYAFINNNPYVYIGNGTTLGGPDTGENHLVLFIEKYGHAGVALYDEAANGIDATHTVELSFAAAPSVITPISNKYLPGVCLPVVELSTTPTAAGAVLTAEESAQAERAAAMRIPVILKTAEMSIILWFTDFGDGDLGWLNTIESTQYVLTRQSGTWTYIVSG